jgi:predicted aldo/keto reductase-like oxidoreductase
MSRTQVSRRDFLRRSAAAAAGAGAAIGGISSGWALDKADIPKRVLGRTGLKVTEIAFGGTRLDDQAVLNYGIDRGINFIHGCEEYNRGKSFPEYCAVLKKRRDEVVFGLKRHPDPERLDDDLEQLGIDYVDILAPGVHTVEEIAGDELKDGLLSMKKKGKAKWVGFACHNNQPEVLSKAIEMGYFDVVLLAYSAANKDQLDPIIEKMDKVGMGLVVMKSVRGLPRGASLADEETPIKAILSNPKVDSLVRGFNTAEMVDEYIKWSLTKTANYCPDDEKRITAMMAGVACTMCGNCGVCPRNVAVTDILRYEYYAQDGQLDVARDKYAALSPCSKATNCDLCGLCEQVCSNDLPIRERLKEVHTLLT